MCHYNHIFVPYDVSLHPHDICLYQCLYFHMLLTEVVQPSMISFYMQKINKSIKFCKSIEHLNGLESFSVETTVNVTHVILCSLTQL